MRNKVQGERQPATPAHKPLHPYLVLATGMVLPCFGQVLNGEAIRGLFMLFFLVLLGVVSYQLTTPEQSILGRYAGGWFIYAVAFMDAYQTARYRWTRYWHDRAFGGDDS